MKVPKFKIGQKVRFVEWVDMPVEVIATWGKIIGWREETGVIEKENNEFNISGYDVKVDGTSIFCLSQELEPVIKVGEQLTFAFMQTCD